MPVLHQAVTGVPADVFAARSGILGHLALGVCASFEARQEAGTATGTWTDVGYFLIDAASGMLAAPVTSVGAVVDVPRPDPIL